MPALVQETDQWRPISVPDATVNGQTYAIKRYRPRIEGLFARIERWQRQSDGDMHWRAVTKDNVTSIYGQNPNCRIADPADASRVFKWLLETTFDDKGNVIFYKYKAEDATGINPAAANERNRLERSSRHSRIFTSNAFIMVRKLPISAKKIFQSAPIGFLKLSLIMGSTIRESYPGGRSGTQLEHPCRSFFQLSLHI